jgi:hypothetical protein
MVFRFSPLLYQHSWDDPHARQAKAAATTATEAASATTTALMHAAGAKEPVTFAPDLRIKKHE